MPSDTLYRTFRDATYDLPYLGQHAQSRGRRWQRFALPDHLVWLTAGLQHFASHQSAHSITQSLQSGLDAPLSAYRFLLMADPAAPQTSYDITQDVQQGLAGDLSVVRRLRGRTLCVIRLHRRPGGVDLLDRDAVGHWLDQDLSLDEASQGVFVALPSFCFAQDTPIVSLPWHDSLLDWTEAPLLFEESYASGTTRLAFWEQLVRTFRDSCLGQMREWLHEHHREFSLLLPRNLSAGPLLSLEWLGQADTIVTESDLAAPLRHIQLRQTKSVAHQTGEQTACVLGQPSHQRDVIDGLDEFLSGRSLPGRRIAHLTTAGLSACRLAFLYPSESLWLERHSGNAQASGQLTQWYNRVMSWGYEADLIDPTALVERGRTNSDGELSIGRATYQRLIVPPGVTLSTSVLEQLHMFVSSRGRLVLLTPHAHLTDGRLMQGYAILEQLLMKRQVDVIRGDQSAEVLFDKLLEIPQTLELYERPAHERAQGILRRERTMEHRRWYFLWNAASQTQELLAEIAGDYHFEQWHYADGTRISLQGWLANGYTYAELALPPAELVLLVASQS